MIFPYVKQEGFPGGNTWSTTSVSIKGGRGVSVVCGKSRVMERTYGGRAVQAVVPGLACLWSYALELQLAPFRRLLLSQVCLLPRLLAQVLAGEVLGTCSGLSLDPYLLFWVHSRWTHSR